MTNNVVLFPNIKKDSPLQSIDEVMGSVVAAREAQVDFLTDEIMSFIVYRAIEDGFDIDGNENVKLKVLMLESVRAMLLATQNIDHFLADVADELISFDDEESEDE